MKELYIQPVSIKQFSTIIVQEVLKRLEGNPVRGDP